MKWRIPIQASLSAVLLCGLAARAEAATVEESMPVAPATSVDNRDQPPSDGREHLRIGALGSFGFPRPLAVEALVKIERVLVIGAEYSFLPELTVSDVHTTLWALAADARFFPFGSIFFVGARVGEQHLSGSGSAVVPSFGTVSETLTEDTWFINPRIGLLWTMNPGITIGIDAGLQIPLSTTETSTLPLSLASSLPAQYAGTVNTVTSVTDYLGRSVIPTVDLLQLGVMF